MNKNSELPVVGKRYKATESNDFVVDKDISLICDEVSEVRVVLGKGRDGSYLAWPVKDFFKDFEELPEDKAEIKKDLEKINNVSKAIIG